MRNVSLKRLFDNRTVHTEDLCKRDFPVMSVIYNVSAVNVRLVHHRLCIHRNPVVLKIVFNPLEAVSTKQAKVVLTSVFMLEPAGFRRNILKVKLEG